MGKPKVSATAAHASADTLAAKNATASDPVVTGDKPGAKLIFAQANYDRLILTAALSAEPIINVSLAPYETAGRAALAAAQYRLSTAATATASEFDTAMTDISVKCSALFFDAIFRPDDAIRAVIFLDACDALGIDQATSRRVPFRRMLQMFSHCFTLEKATATGSIRPNSAEFIKSIVPGNALPVHTPGEKTPKAQVKPTALANGLTMHYEECRKVAPDKYPVRLAPKRGAKGKGKGAGRNWAKFKATSATELVEHLAAANNTKALAALVAAIKAVKARTAAGNATAAGTKKA